MPFHIGVLCRLKYPFEISVDCIPHIAFDSYDHLDPRSL
jgi:hypothetical protein